ncbi:MAG: L-serine ammonia-lyase, iron-sulfur-dependent, subunit alpha [Clostridiales bacterium]|nr:L-serine ammonia-lyase, iron-sulfur-dependent, subunit alpha [Clostridiales bacterium]
MSFTSLATLMEDALDTGVPISELVITIECEDYGVTPEFIYEKLQRTLSVMRSSCSEYIEKESFSLSGLTGGYAVRMGEYIKNCSPLAGETVAKAAMYALSASEVNASMGVIAAAPTAGACGILPGVLLAVGEKLGSTDDDLIRALLTGTGVGAVIATRATISGAEGGCQAECGTAAAMAAAAACELKCAPADVCINAAALALKNSLGLACDPVCGLVEVPCVKRNAIFTSVAITAADMSLAGIKSVIPADDVVDAMMLIATEMPASIRESGLGGLAITETGRKLKRCFEEKSEN